MFSLVFRISHLYAFAVSYRVRCNECPTGATEYLESDDSSSEVVANTLIYMRFTPKKMITKKTRPWFTSKGITHFYAPFAGRCFTAINLGSIASPPVESKFISRQKSVTVTFFWHVCVYSGLHHLLLLLISRVRALTQTAIDHKRGKLKGNTWWA